MNLQSLYDLKDRLEHCAIAGTSLITEDFRLKRAMDAFSPLAAASPVFARIKAGCDALLCAPAEQRGTALLDVLGLVDAVVYTQGSSGIQGEPVPIRESGFQHLNIPYSALSALKDALTGTGAGRMIIINQFHEEHPEYFSDARVVEYTVKALCCTYSDLAELAETILAELGESIIPLLKDGFQPDGKTEMVRRVRVIANIRGGEENEWYKSVLPESKKAVREALITALGYCQDNTALLLELCRSEKGTVREAAMQSLAHMDSPEAREFWQNGKGKDHTLLLMTVDSVLAADITSAAFREAVEKLLSSDGNDNDAKGKSLGELELLSGKYSEAVRSCWLELLPYMDRLNAINSAIPVTGVTCDRDLLSMAEQLDAYMLQTVERKPCAEVFALARELHEKCPKHFAAAAFAADILELPSDVLYEKYACCFTEDYSDKPFVCRQILSAVKMVIRPSEKGFFYRTNPLDRMSDTFVNRPVPIPSPDPRWAAVLTAPGLRELLDKTEPEKGKLFYYDYDSCISHFLDPDSPEMCRIFGKYFCERMVSTGDISEYWYYLISCGWTEWDGVLSAIYKKKGTVDCRSFISMLEEMLASSEVKLRELSRIEALILSGKLKPSGAGYKKEEFEIFRAQLESEQ